MLEGTISFDAMTRRVRARGIVPPVPPERPMVLHARVVSGAGGGPDKTILRSPHFLDHERFDMAAAYLYPTGDPGIRVIQGHAERWGCPLHLIPEGGPVDTRSLRDMLELCRRLNVTIWHAHDYKSNLMGVLLRRRWPMRLVTTVHGWTCDSPRARLYYWLDRQVLRFYEKVILVSPSLMEPCLSHGVPMERIVYVPNAIDPADFQRQHTRMQARERLGLNPERRIIGLIGRLSPEKGIDRAIDVLAHLRRHHPTIELHVIGDGPEKAKLQLHARNNGVAEAVHFQGWQPDVRPWLEAMDVLLSASHQEAAANVLLEAMAME
ncbi:MAG: glycosyltransferase, partial [Phycisphaeraceae bacterium]|nr:glycosyltransferase [Phycisphaeraceae bacterium]